MLTGLIYFQMLRKTGIFLNVFKLFIEHCNITHLKIIIHLEKNKRRNMQQKQLLNLSDV